MSQDFMYLGNNPGTTLYPKLDNLDVQKTVTKFNWSLWGANTKLYLKHVPANWSNDYSNVVEFTNKAERDKYLKTNNPITLDTEFRIAHDGKIRLPIPYDNLIDYNYLIAEYPDAPVPNYDGTIARKNYYYFIQDCEYIAPNTTEITLDLDVWTTYLDDINITMMQLERGHYPMTLSNVDSYLANPLNNRIGLDTVDVNFGELSKIPKNHKTDLMGEKVYLVAATSNPKTFTKNVTTHNGNGMHPGLYYFCIKAENWVDWCKATASKTPAFFQTIKGILILQDVLFNFTENFDFNGIKCYSYSLNKSLVNYTFTKSDFGYDSKYQWITKLYTSPYAMIEVIDPNGNKQQIKYEDLYVGKMAINLFGAISLNNSTLKAIVMNIGGNSSNGDFNQITVDIPLPNASVNLSPSVKYLFETEYPRIQQQNDINTSYNTGIASAKTGKTNADASAATGKTNADASADTGSTITKRGNDQARDFATHDMLNSLDINEINIKNNTDISHNQIVNMLSNANTNVLSEYVTQLSKTWSNNTAVMNSGINGLVSGNYLAGVAGMGQTFINTNYNTDLAADLFNFSSGVIGAMAQFNATLQNAINGNSTHINKTISTEQGDIDTNGWWPGGEISGGITTTVDVPANEGLINKNSRDVLNKSNENNVYKRDESYKTAESNRKDTLDTSKANNLRSYNQAIANNKRSYDTTVSNLQAVKANSEEAIQNAIKQSHLNDNAKYGSDGDISKFDKSMMAINFHVKTQSNDAIARTGDYFLRYGYSYEGNVSSVKYNLMKHFTFWKAREVWLSSNKCNNNVINIFKNIFLNGVTVWRNPDDMDKSVLYDNTIL